MPDDTAPDDAPRDAPASDATAPASDPAVLARRLWPLIEVVHAIVYFAPEHRDAMVEVGLKGGWMGYFAGRAAPMGAVSPAVVEAVFHNFHGDMVRRALPDAWSLAGGPEAVLAARGRAVDAALRRLLGDAVADPAVTAAAEALWDLAAAAPIGARPLGAANRALPRPSEPHQVLWQACTTLRELRGDGHVLALTAAGVEGLTAHVLKAAQGADAARLRAVRGFDEDTWSAAVAEAQARGSLAADGTLTAEGQALVEGVEAATDRLAGTAFTDVGAAAAEALEGNLRVTVDAVLAAGEIPFPNPIGVPRP